jgi:4-alpha-glucanotransferase
MKYKRSSGILLHPTSLPGPDGIGDLGPETFRWINFLADTGCSLWQVLPLGPTGYGDSPYQCFSAFAGNPYLVSPALLLSEGLLTRADLADRPEFPEDHVDFGLVIQWKLEILNRACARFDSVASIDVKADFAAFCKHETDWLDDYAMFMAIKEAHGGVAWGDWPEPLRMRKEAALKKFAEEHGQEIKTHRLRQFFFFRQWQAVHAYAREKDIQIVGDVPIFVAYDSADAWSHPELFYMDSKRRLTCVAGVPPDYFSPTGQLWGNPLYRWEAHKHSGYAWWIKRMRSALAFFDVIRMDHFRGFAGYWEVPAGMPTAEVGRWMPGPGASLFQAIKDALGDLPIIAEDLGKITPDVLELRDGFELPGMRIFQFSFSTDGTDPFLPHNYIENCVAYTGTHDNDTARGWYHTAPESERDFCRRYLGRSGEDISWDLIRAIWSSVAVMTLAPMQDLLSLDGLARMNFPGKASGNWGWRMPASALNEHLKHRMLELNFLYARRFGDAETSNKGHI